MLSTVTYYSSYSSSSFLASYGADGANKGEVNTGGVDAGEFCGEKY